MNWSFIVDFHLDTTPYDYTLRVFHMTSVSGNFDVHEILNPSRSPDLSTPFPVLQADLYNVSQPGEWGAS